jgi:hypothetical protein
MLEPYVLHVETFTPRLVTTEAQNDLDATDIETGSGNDGSGFARV